VLALLIGSKFASLHSGSTATTLKPYTTHNLAQESVRPLSPTSQLTLDISVFLICSLFVHGVKLISLNLTPERLDILQLFPMLVGDTICFNTIAELFESTQKSVFSGNLTKNETLVC